MGLGKSILDKLEDLHVKKSNIYLPSPTYIHKFCKFFLQMTLALLFVRQMLISDLEEQAGQDLGK